jgi:dihydropyrimidinase
MQHDNMDYTPFEGREFTGVPELVMNRGAVIVEKGELKASKGQGRFFGRAPVDLRGRPGVIAPEFDPAQNFGTVLR